MSIACNVLIIGKTGTGKSSFANYLFDDFNGVISRLSRSLPREKKIPVNYEFINQISSNK